MGIIDDIKKRFSIERTVLHTKYGDLNLAKKSDVKLLKRQVLQLQRATDALIRRDIGDWRNAWQMAIDVDNPDRRTLYDIYKDVDVDLHLSGCIEQRKGFVRSRSFKLSDEKGNENEEALVYFDTQWFKQLMGYVLDSIYWGHSLVELGDVTTDGNGLITYNGVTLIPRKHVIPEFHVVTPNIYEDWRSGIDYHCEPFASWLTEAGKPEDLGIYLKAATQTIPKKNMLAFWDTFGEIFGMPMRIAKTTTRDPKELSKIEKMLANMGTEAYGLLSEGTELEMVETGKTDAFNVYDKRIDRANSELSKLVIGQTMTIEDGSSLSQSETHLKVFQNLVESDCDMFRDIVNNQLLPRMVAHGFPLKGLRFDWDYSTDYTPEQQVAYETMIADRYDVDPKYFEDKYGIPCKQKQKPLIPGNDGQDPNDTNTKTKPKKGKGVPTGTGANEPDEKKKKKANNSKSFFD